MADESREVTFELEKFKGSYVAVPEGKDDFDREHDWVPGWLGDVLFGYTARNGERRVVTASVKVPVAPTRPRTGWFDFDDRFFRVMETSNDCVVFDRPLRGTYLWSNKTLNEMGIQINWH